MPDVWLLPLVLFCLLSPVAGATASASSGATPEFDVAPLQLVKQTVEKALARRDKDPSYWAYRATVHKEGKVETHEIFQTPEATIDRLIAINNQPLSGDQQAREDARIQALLADYSELAREKRKQREDMARQMRMFAMFPSAFRYEYLGREGEFVKLKFEPNPAFVPSSRQEEVFHHLEGVMWIDPQQRQLARIDGTLTSEVRFAGGLLGHLDKGGVFSVRFQQLNSGQWVMAALHVEMSGRALLFKTISVQEERDFDDYRPMPGNLGLKQLAALIQRETVSLSQTAANTPQ